MEAYLASTVYGVFVVDKDGKVLAAARRAGDEDAALTQLLDRARSMGVDRLLTTEPEMSKYAELVQPESVGGSIYSDEAFSESLGMSLAEAREAVRKQALGSTRKGVAEQSGRKDKIVAQAVNAVDEFDKTLNIFASRIREWYGLHFPELGEVLEDNASYLRAVSTLGLRANFTEEAVRGLDFPAETSARIAQMASDSIGGELSEEDFEPIRVMSQAVYQLYSLRNRLTGYIENLMNEVAPNLTGMAGAVLGARLIASAGDLERLAKFPSSTVQVLGAEKALFRAIRRGAKPPKHGVIFQDPLIHSAPRWQRGKIARSYAGKLSIAARVDFYGGEDISKSLRAQFEARVNEIKSSFPNPPRGEPREEPHPGGSFGGGGGGGGGRRGGWGGRHRGRRGSGHASEGRGWSGQGSGRRGRRGFRDQ
ncbi:MAG: C/D box methylation guide ribonucleoprotein complex aNOP56 subunit [Candidatus Marsarchaeota archaeon]|nr:C/D box methylation guide ribonucleoprotein complex aNOP56 subunit [Candidatus Marsarchaeota archaeon]